MPRLNALRKHRGFSLAESLVIAAVLALLMAFSAPGIAGALDRVKLNQAVVDVRGAFQESQRQAIRRGQPCAVQISSNQRQVSGSCLMTGNRTLPEHIQLATNVASANSDVQIIFGILGTAEFGIQTESPTANDPSAKIVFFLDRSSIPDKKCIVISNTLGLSRIGQYSGATGGSAITDTGVCTTSG
jgi:type II secretory pathway pseudopilin PulG